MRTHYQLILNSLFSPKTYFNIQQQYTSIAQMEYFI